MFHRGPTLDTSGGNRIIWTLEDAQVGSMLGTFGETVVGCTLGGGVLRGVGSTLGDAIGSRWGCVGGASGM
jgi:hypothetical protein